ncbi:MAG: sugar phosphate isomerase/epimerase [Terriglobales bacterium]
MNRRKFIGTLSAATLMANRFSWAFAAHKIEKIGLQLYTVRFPMKEDFAGSIAKVAAIGYKEVELAEFAQDAAGKVTYFGRSPAEVRAALDSQGLSVPSTHVNFKSLAPDNFARVLEASKILGHSYIVNPWIDDDVRKQPDGWKRAAETFNRAGEACQKAGIQFAYHNHWFEFIPVDGKMPYDFLLKETDPALVKMELDLCWIVVGGQDPVKYFEQYPGRFPLVHVKDMKKLPVVDASGGQNFGDSLDMTSVGNGVIDWKRILGKFEQAGIKHYFVEHDKPQDPFASIQSSYAYLKLLRF